MKSKRAGSVDGAVCSWREIGQLCGRKPEEERGLFHGLW